jgi:hypothetical protein
MVRCKFRCLEVTERYVRTDADGTDITQPTVRLVPVMYNKKGGYDPSPENKSFWEATPSGEMTMTITNPAAAKQFVVGKTYYVDFAEAAE